MLTWQQTDSLIGNDSGAQRIFPWAGLCAAILIAWLIVFSWVPKTEGADRAAIVADGVFSFDGDQWVAVGGVQLTQNGTKITADRLLYRTDEETVFFEGNVHLTTDEGTLRGNTFTYDLERSVGSLAEAAAEIDLETTPDSAYLFGDIIDFEEDHLTIHDARFTTCTPPETAGYYLLSRRIDVFPGDRIVIRNVRFVESGVVLFYWPYLSISLKDRKRSRIQIPEIGHSDTDGWYAKIRFPYDGPGDGYGDIGVDVSQYGGYGAGISHVYREEGDSRGSVSVFGTNNPYKDEQSLSVRWDEAFAVSDSLRASASAFARAEADPYHADQEVEGTVSLTHRGVGSSTAVDLAGRFRAEGDGDTAGKARVTHNRTISGWRLRTETDLFRHVVGDTIEKDTWAYNVSGVKRTPGYTLRVESQRRAHGALLTDRSTSRPAWRYFDRPIEVEATFNLSTLVSRRLPLEIGVGYGMFGEERRLGNVYIPTEADRKTVSLGTTFGSLSLGQWGRLTYRGLAEHRWYSTGEQRTIYTVDHQYRLPLGSRWSFYGNYTYRDALGDPSPFRFDGTGIAERFRARLQYLSPTGSASLSSGYDFRTERATDLLGQVVYRPADRVDLELQGGYSLNNQHLTYGATRINVRPFDGLSLSTAARYDFQHDRFTRIDAGMSLAYLGWSLDVDTSYVGATQQLSRGTVSLVKDLDCRQVGVRYDSDRGEVWLEYVITAFPQAPIRFGADSDNVLFDVDPLLDLF